MKELHSLVLRCQGDKCVEVHGKNLEGPFVQMQGALQRGEWKYEPKMEVRTLPGRRP